MLNGKNKNNLLVRNLDFISTQPLTDVCATFRGFSHEFKEPVNPDTLSRIGILVGVQNQGEPVPSSRLLADEGKPYTETILCQLQSDNKIKLIRQRVNVLRESDGALVAREDFYLPLH